MTCYDVKKVRPGVTLTFQYHGGSKPHQLRSVKVEDVRGDRIYATEDGDWKCFLLSKIGRGWFEDNTKKVDFSVNLDTVLNMLSVTHPVHSVDFDGKKFNFYRKN